MNDQGKKRLLICYDHFYPAYKAGGPIQSLTNLAISLNDVYSIFVLTSAYDLNENDPLPGIRSDRWEKVELPGTGIVVNVWYASRHNMGKAGICNAIRIAGPACVYLNGMFSYPFLLVPLISFRNTRTVICPRGMLQKGALAGKALKKSVYLSGLRLTGLCRNVLWHATNSEEREDIQKHFGKKANVVIAGNIPKEPVGEPAACIKKSGRLRLVYLSLISEKKNLLQLVNIISGFPGEISLDVYGPVKDREYFDRCMRAIDRSNGKVAYRGDVRPSAVQETFAKYDASVLLTKGENFGHAIYESLSAGRPVITSVFTPWKSLREKGAGWNVDINDEPALIKLMNDITVMDTSSFSEYCQGAHKLARQYYRDGCGLEAYRDLFS